jgi:hypothetical protein
MTRNQIDQLTRLLQEAQQLITDLDCGPLECHACVDTEDMAYIELPIDGDGVARSLSDWTFALEVLVALARSDWSQGELYTAFQAVMNNTNPFEEPLPDWEEVEALMAEQARVRRNYPNLLLFLERPDEYINSLRRKSEEKAQSEDIPLIEATKLVAAQAVKNLREEIKMAYGEKATPEIFRAYQAWKEENGDFVAWVYRALNISYWSPPPKELWEGDDLIGPA